jgi:hypothetical protein
MQASISRREAEAKPELGFAEERLIAVGMNSTIDMALEVVTLPVSMSIARRTSTPAWDGGSTAGCSRR